MKFDKSLNEILERKDTWIRKCLFRQESERPIPHRRIRAWWPTCQNSGRRRRWSSRRSDALFPWSDRGWCETSLSAFSPCRQEPAYRPNMKTISLLDAFIKGLKILIEDFILNLEIKDKLSKSDSISRAWELLRLPKRRNRIVTRPYLSGNFDAFEIEIVQKCPSVDDEIYELNGARNKDLDWERANVLKGQD